MPDEVKADPDAYIEIGEFHHDELTVRRAQLYWRRQTRKKFKSKEDRSLPPLVAPAPAPSVPGTMCDPDLIAMIIADSQSEAETDDPQGRPKGGAAIKYFYHDPQYRQSTRFLMRFGAILSRQTVNQWTHAGMDLLASVGEAILRELRLAEIIQADAPERSGDDCRQTARRVSEANQTPMPLPRPRTRQHLPGVPLVVSQRGVRNRQLRLAARPRPQLPDRASRAGRRGRELQCQDDPVRRLQRDPPRGLRRPHQEKVYRSLCRGPPEESGEILSIIRRLYQIERPLRNTVATASCRTLVRQGRARPLVKQLKEKILAEHGRHRPRSKFGEALDYHLGQWEQIERYLGEGRLEPEHCGDRLPQAARRANAVSQIDNNLTENLIRPSNLGFKNYLFFSSAGAGSGSALIYTLIANCRVQGLDPERYFAEAMPRLSPDTTTEQAAEPTPAKLAPLIRQLQPRPACADKPCADAFASVA